MKVMETSQPTQKVKPKPAKAPPTGKVKKDEKDEQELDLEGTPFCYDCRENQRVAEENMTTEQQLHMMGYGTQVPDPTKMAQSRLSRLICHTCMKLVCRECLYQCHRGDPFGQDSQDEGSEKNEMHDFEPIEDFKVRVK